KTTVARNIAEKLGKEDVTFLSLDWYYRDQSDVAPEELDKLNMDHPNAFDCQLLLTHLRQLQQGLPIEAPVYDFHLHKRISETVPITPKPVAIVEGILIFAMEELRSALDFKIFVDADADIRLIRRLSRDIKERGSTFDDTIRRYLSTVKPMHDAFVEPSKRYADIIVPRGGENQVATNLLADFLEKFMVR
ncbi:MAG: uridine kinase, partial [Actinobacteria bacterium]|nr:uridine kinase [Actinomycetota bacterium]